jgi:hypothetical protein
MEHARCVWMPFSQGFCELRHFESRGCLHKILLLQNSILSSAVTVLPKVHLGSYFGGLSHGHIEASQGMSASRQHSSCSG